MNIGPFKSAGAHHQNLVKPTKAGPSTTGPAIGANRSVSTQSTQSTEKIAKYISSNQGAFTGKVYGELGLAVYDDGNIKNIPAMSIKPFTSPNPSGIDNLINSKLVIRITYENGQAKRVEMNKVLYGYLTEQQNRKIMLEKKENNKATLPVQVTVDLRNQTNYQNLINSYFEL